MNGKALSKIFAAIALVIFAAAIIGRLAFDMDPVTLVCVGGGIMSASVLLDKWNQ